MVKEMVESIVKALVDKPDRSVIKVMVGDTTTVLEIRVDPSDVGKIIGRQGKNAEAIRTLVNCIGAKEKHRYLVQVDG